MDVDAQTFDRLRHLAVTRLGVEISSDEAHSVMSKALMGEAQGPLHLLALEVVDPTHTTSRKPEQTLLVTIAPPVKPRSLATWRLWTHVLAWSGGLLVLTGVILGISYAQNSWRWDYEATRDSGELWMSILNDDDSYEAPHNTGDTVKAWGWTTTLVGLAAIGVALGTGQHAKKLRLAGEASSTRPTATDTAASEPTA